MPRGRPPKSQIRQNMVAILQYAQPLNGYSLYKIYCSVYDAVSLRVIYYHLMKGTEYNEFVVENVSVERGHFSWGSNAEKIFYKLGPNAKPQTDDALKKKIETFQLHGKSNISL